MPVTNRRLYLFKHAHRLRSRGEVLQARLRHASARASLDTYAHLLPDSAKSTRSAIDALMATPAHSLSGSSVNAST